MSTTPAKLKKKITLGDLAVMIKRQFDFLEEKMATKDDIVRLENKIDGFGRRFEKIEEIVLQDHRPRIIALEKETGLW